MNGTAFHLELARLRAEFNRLRAEHASRHRRTPVEERDHLDRFSRWIGDVESFRRMYLADRLR